MDASSEGRVYRFSPPFPTGPDAAGGCGRTDGLGSPLADPDRVNREVFIEHGSIRTPSGIARAPGGTWMVSSVLFGRISEFDENGDFLRSILCGNRLPADDLIIASVRNAWAARAFDMPYLVSLGKDLCRLIRDDYDRLSSIMRRISN